MKKDKSNLRMIYKYNECLIESKWYQLIKKIISDHKILCAKEVKVACELNQANFLLEKILKMAWKLNCT